MARIAALLVSSALASVYPAITLAQVAPSPAPAEPVQGLEEIVVTAQRTEQSSQRAAVAIDVVSAKELVAAGVTQVARLNDLAPALTVQPTSTGNLIFIRGVGNFTLTPNSDPATAFNYDEVYVGRATATSGMFFDLERVEVLKGPQGTLYGRNATGGAINVIPVHPHLGERSGYATVTYGRFDTLTAEGAINIPIGDKVAARISASRVQHDGYLSDGTGDQDDASLRAQARADLTEDLTIRVAADYERIAGIGSSVSYVGDYRFNPVTGYTFRPAPTGPTEGIFTAASQAYRQTIGAGPAGRTLTPLDIGPFQDNDFYGANAQIEWRVAGGTLTVVPAWRYAKENYLSSAGAFAYRQRQKSEQVSLETRFNGARVGIFDYVVGAYLFRETIDLNTALSLSAAANFLDNKYATTSLAPFGRLTANLSDRLRLVGGVRYTEDKKKFSGSTIGNTIVCLVRVNNAPTCPTTPLFPFVEDINKSPIPLPAANGPPRPILVNGAPTGAIVVRSDRYDDNRLKNDRMTYRAAAEFDLAERSLLYGSLETGYRSGGFSPATGFDTFEPEYLTAYTLGSKNRFLDNRVQFNVEAFWWNYRNQQVSAVRNDLDGRTANITQNIGSSRIRGIEAEGRVLLGGTLLSTDIQYLDAKNRNFVYQQANSGAPPLVGCGYTLNTASNLYNVDCSDLPAFNAPRWTANFGVQQTIRLQAYELVLQADTQYKTSRYAGFAYLREQLLPSVWQSNAQVRFGPAEGRWSLAAFVRNIENNHAVAYSSTTPLTNALVAGPTSPRTYGVRASVSF